MKESIEGLITIGSTQHVNTSNDPTEHVNTGIMQPSPVRSDGLKSIDTWEMNDFDE